ncbi:MAG: DUF6293 family protein [Candidatus Bilamarchaeaceae archaeon]
MPNAFLREKPARIIVALRSKEKEYYMSELARETGVSFVYLSKILPGLEAKGLVKMEKQGKKQMVRLTEKGAEIANLIEDLRKRLEQLQTMQTPITIPQSMQTQTAEEKPVQ